MPGLTPPAPLIIPPTLRPYALVLTPSLPGVSRSMQTAIPGLASSWLKAGSVANPVAAKTAKPIILDEIAFCRRAIVHLGSAFRWATAAPKVS
jgi:hypothetical protein